MDVDDEKWELSKNKGPPRVQTGPKQRQIQEQIQDKIELDVMQPSQAEYYSQAHLVPKSLNKWRFCLDYRNLNQAVKGMGWPIPNIQQMLRRLGDYKSKFYAKMDLTSGYHQAPLAPESRKYTAFITFMGVFEWLRVPMGLKSATSWFQGCLASIVLAGLIYFICELYVDDVIVHGKTKEQFLHNLEEVFKRF